MLVGSGGQSNCDRVKLVGATFFADAIIPEGIERGSSFDWG